MRAIDADALKEHLSGRYMTELFPDWYQLPLDAREKFALYGRTIKQAILDAPTIDAVPVVRCKECKHRGHDACPMYFEYDEYDEFEYESRDIDNTVDDGFCHKGAKRDVSAEC